MTETVSVVLVQANPDDLKVHSHYDTISGGEQVSVEKLRHGQVYKVKSKETGKFDNKFYITGPNTNTAEIAFWLENKMIYIPAETINEKQ